MFNVLSYLKVEKTNDLQTSPHPAEQSIKTTKDQTGVFVQYVVFLKIHFALRPLSHFLHLAIL